MRPKYLPALFSGLLILALSLGAVQADAQSTPSSSVPVITVNNNGDKPDANGGSGVCETEPGNGQCTLRAAIQTAEYEYFAEAVEIVMGLGITVIAPQLALPDLIHGDVTITGNGVYLSGLNAGVASGFRIYSDNNKIQGFHILGFNRHGVYIYGGNNNVIGVDGDGIADDSEGNTIVNNGAPGISTCGVHVWGNNNRISGNSIGTEGASAAPNDRGICIYSGTGNLIGTDGNGVSDTLEPNVISGNEGVGVYMSTNSNTVAGNYIGVNAAGTAALGNEYGVYVSGAAHNVIGTNGDGNGDSSEGNVISGNNAHGVLITGAGADYNRVAGNYIGLDSGGSQAVPNLHGVYISNAAQYNIIGTNLDWQSDVTERNVISGNTNYGVTLDGSGTLGNRVVGNYIGLTANGLSALGNRDGVRLESGTSDNAIGDIPYAARNVISGNTLDGMYVYQSGTNNSIKNNLIGTDKNGLAAIPNDRYGISIHRSSGNTVGGTVSGARNVIAGNGSTGVRLAYDSSENILRGNYIGVGLDGVKPVGNSGSGVGVSDGAHHNTIGDVVPGGGNVIAHNGYHGVSISHSYCIGNAIRGNDIYSNTQWGIKITSGKNPPVLLESHNQPFPAGLIVSGTLTSTANMVFELDFFVNERCDPDPEGGEGQAYVGSLTLGVGPSGTSDFVSLLDNDAPGTFVTATATDAEGNTSQFSHCIRIGGPGSVAQSVYLPLVMRAPTR